MFYLKKNRFAAVLFIFAGMVFFATAAVSGTFVYIGLGIAFTALGIYYLVDNKESRDKSGRKEG